MKINNKIVKILSLALIIAMIIPSFSFAGGKVSKEETVYVNLDEKGTPIEKISSVWLHSDTSLGKVKDKSTLKDIKNVKGEEKPKRDGNKIVWETDKKDIFYQGKTNKSLPVDIEVKYYLDGKCVEPKDIVGKSGKLKIKLKVKNKDSHVVNFKNGKDKTLFTPFATVVVMNMPLDKFDNIKLNSGKLVSDANNQVITYVSLPGFKESLDLEKDVIDIPDYLEVKADVKDFEMNPIVITVTSDIPEIKGLDEAKDFDELIEGIEKIKDASEKLSEATGKLYDGQKELNNGIDELIGGVGRVNIGANSLKDGTKKLKDGVDASYKGSQDISNGANTLSKSAGQIGKGVKGVGDGTVQFSQKAKEFSKGASEVANGVAQIPEKTEQMNVGMKDIVENTAKIQQGQEKLSKGLAKSTSALDQIKKGKEKELKVVEMLLKGMDGLDALVAGVGKIPGASNIAGQLNEGLQKQRMALQGLKDSGTQLVEGLSQVEEGIREAQGASEQLSDNLGKINKGQGQISQGMDQLAKGTSGLKDASGKLVEGSSGLSAGADKLNEGANKVSKGTKQFADGSKALANGAGKLTNGLGELDKGTGQLYDGVNTLSKGTDELFKGGNKLKDGSNKLTDGTKQLDENMKKFHQEGIAEMSNRINESDFDIDTIIETKDELVNLSKDYKSFTGLSEDMDGSVKFVIKTKEVKAEKEKEVLEDVKTEEPEEKGGFINWLKNLFKRKK